MKMALTSSQGSASLPFPIYVFIFSCLAYLCRGLVVNFFQSIFSVDDGEKPPATGSTLDLAEKGSLKSEESLSEEEVFQLEKRAFFSKVCQEVLRL